MPSTKHALIRYRVINRYLINNQYATKEELKKACEEALDIEPIGLRTIDGDIHAMRYDRALNYEAPIKFDRYRKAYYYDDPDYSIDNISLNEEELDSLVFASRLLEQFKGLSILETFAGSVQKLVDAISIYRQEHSNEYPAFIDFEKVEEAAGTEYIEELMDALKSKTVVKITYRSFTSGENKEHIVHPYLLKEYRNRWYLIGHNEKFKNACTYALDRFVKLEKKQEVRFKDTGFDAREYYRNVTGVSVLNKKPVQIHIAFSELQAQYVITQPLHPSQKRIENIKDKIVFSYFLVPNFEFYQQILGWGNEVEVLKPDTVRKEVRNIANGILSLYK